MNDLELSDLDPLVMILRENREHYWNGETKERFTKVLSICNSR